MNRVVQYHDNEILKKKDTRQITTFVIVILTAEQENIGIKATKNIDTTYVDNI